MWYIFTKNKLFGIAVACIMIAIVIVTISCIKTYNWSFAIQKMLTTKAGNEIIIQNFEKQLSLYQGGFNEKYGKLLTVRPASDNLPSFLNTIDSIAANSRVGKFLIQNIQGASSSKTSTKDASPTLHYRINFEATPVTLDSFLKLLDEMRNYIRIDELSIRTKENMLLSELSDVSMTFTIFIR